jgi:hypothetical protein
LLFKHFINLFFGKQPILLWIAANKSAFFSDKVRCLFDKRQTLLAISPSLFAGGIGFFGLEADFVVFFTAFFLTFAFVVLDFFAAIKIFLRVEIQDSVSQTSI